MKTLLCALVFFFPLAVIAEEIAPPNTTREPTIILKGLPYGLETGSEIFRTENATPGEELRLHLNCCVPPASEDDRSVFRGLKQRDRIRNLLREKRRVQLYVINPDRPELGRLSFERHQKMYGFWYRQEYGIFEDPRSLDHIFRWLSPPEEP